MRQGPYELPHESRPLVAAHSFSSGSEFALKQDPLKTDHILAVVLNTPDAGERTLNSFIDVHADFLTHCLLRTKANICEQGRIFVNQQSFPWVSGIQDPIDVPGRVVKLCRSDDQAIARSIEICRAKYGRTQVQIAQLCGWSSDSYLSEIRRGKKSMPENKVALFCFATGCNLLRQYRQRQEQLRAMTGKVTERDRNRAAVTATIAAWSKAA
jgi:hypothetical protein